MNAMNIKVTIHHVETHRRSLTTRCPSVVPRPIPLHHRAATLASIVSLWLLAAAGTSTGTTTSSSFAPSAVTKLSAVTVTIRNYAFLPRNFTANPGATVTVRNEDQAIHTLTADNRAFNTGNVTDDLPVTFTVPTQPGKYPFHCLHHAYMTGILTVSSS
jgi:plastocyanin